MNLAQQRADALTKANAVRVAVAQIKRQAAALSDQAAREMVAGLIRTAGPPVDAARVDLLLTACRYVGPTTVNRVFRHAGVNGHPRLRELSAGRREMVAIALMLPPPDPRREKYRAPGTCPNCRAMGAELARLRAGGR